MGNKDLSAEVLDRHLRPARELMFRRDDKRQFVAHHAGGPQRIVVWRKRNHTELDLAGGDLFWDAACDAALDLDLDKRMQLSKFFDNRQQVKDRVLIRADRDLAVTQVAH